MCAKCDPGRYQDVEPRAHKDQPMEDNMEVRLENTDDGIVRESNGMDVHSLVDSQSESPGVRSSTLSQKYNTFIYTSNITSAPNNHRTETANCDLM